MVGKWGRAMRLSNKKAAQPSSDAAHTKYLMKKPFTTAKLNTFSQ